MLKMMLMKMMVMIMNMMLCSPYLLEEVDGLDPI